MAIGVARDNLVSLMTRNPVELRSCVLPDASLPWIRKRTGILRVHRSCERRSRSSFVYTDIGFLRTFSFDPCLGVAWERMAARLPFTFCIIFLIRVLRARKWTPTAAFKRLSQP